MALAGGASYGIGWTYNRRFLSGVDLGGLSQPAATLLTALVLMVPVVLGWAWGQPEGLAAIWSYDAPDAGTWFWLLSSTQYSSGGQIAFGGLGDVPLIGDFDGDRKADLAVWRPSIGTWFWLTSSTNYNPSLAGSRQWGIGSLGDMPLIGDFDGDGRTDLTVWRAIEGTWYWLPSSTGYTQRHDVTFGGLGDKPFLGDFDGDGRADIAVYRPSTGTWFWLTAAGAFGQRLFGGGGNDVPLLTDIDGDGRSDVTIWRPFTGEWFWLTSSSGYSRVRSVVFGGLGDSPIR